MIRTIRLTFEEGQWSISAKPLSFKYATKDEVDLIQKLYNQEFIDPRVHKSMDETKCFQIIDGKILYEQDATLNFNHLATIDDIYARFIDDNYTIPSLFNSQIKRADYAWMFKILHRLQGYYNIKPTRLIYARGPDEYKLIIDEKEICFSSNYIYFISVPLIVKFNVESNRIYRRRMIVYLIGWFILQHHNFNDNEISNFSFSEYSWVISENASIKDKPVPGFKIN